METMECPTCKAVSDFSPELTPKCLRCGLVILNWYHVEEVIFQFRGDTIMGENRPRYAEMYYRECGLIAIQPDSYSVCCPTGSLGQRSLPRN
jgi:hypothetical protein